MKKLLLIIGIVCLAACAAFLLLAVINLLAHSQLMDGTAEHYERLHRRAVAFFATGIGFAAASAACLFFRAKV